MNWPASVFDGLERICILPQATLRDAIQCIDQSDRRIALVVDEFRRLVDTITDGDIRRAILARADLALPVSSLASRRRISRDGMPVTASVSADPRGVLERMRADRLLQIPLLDEYQRVAGVVTMRDMCPEDPLSLAAVVMAGGQGSRLRPLTNDVPKPMLPLAGRPLLERTIIGLKRAGIRRISIATHHLAAQIVDHFGDGRGLGVDLSYVTETIPLGTAGALSLIGRPQRPLLVINGDIVTDVDFRSIYDYHYEHQTDLTVAVRAYQRQVPYGVVDCDGARVTALTEKPRLNVFVNAGIYVIEPSAFDYVPAGRHFDMTDLIQALLGRRMTVAAFPVREYWIDVGENDHYMQAQKDMASGATTLAAAESQA